MRNHFPLCLATFAVSVPAAVAFNHFGFGAIGSLALAPAVSRLAPSTSARSRFSVRMSGSVRLTAEEVLKNPKWPATWPYSAQDFARADESEDEFFYDSPRLVYHIDDKAGRKLQLQFRGTSANDVQNKQLVH
jgi:hypothetical protein